ncbi:glutathione-disulfide reductase [Hyphomicrobium denitrificans ATCC 51888]|uniref:Glutathione reductase n=1 Tax=Hyphomicrobium denitrificans (strain ATCC 51888 / DSM 1869 / NCIMB 11706 / TK 0415) TaxID=582899 RepID=D8JZ46_HYPDA|nr:glutathione-disulfide reductase [Hyphomicrobium denitrificans]ADJ23648.1 glutathione-disulfide reductase [Hyphomicrobium denitrificans ATCC 51888]
MQEFEYDLFVIGAGSGGVRAARIAASYGSRVAIAEEYRVGGTCVIRGCVPKKILVYASRFSDEFENAAGFGWSFSEPSFDWPSLIAVKDKEIARLEAAYGSTLAKFNVEVFAERATVSGPNEIVLASGRKITAKYILIATGGRPNLDPNLPGIEHVITSNEAFDLKTMPRRVVVAGGGYIAVEFASIFNGLGADVTLVYRGEKILRGFDEDLRDGLTAAMTKRGIRIVTGQVFSKIEKSGGALAGHLTGGEILEADAIMFAIGRSPNSTGLGLEAAGVKLDGEGAVVVDAGSRTTVASIYAVGDVTNRVNLTPVAIREGHAFADSVFGGKPKSVDYKMIPTAVFATPEIGTVGFSEHEARMQFGAVDIYKGSFRPMKSIIAGRDERMMMKVIVEAASDRVVGVHLLGPDSAEIAQMAAIALRMGATKSDFDQTMALHPSAAEELVTLREKWVAPGEAAG